MKRQDVEGWVSRQAEVLGCWASATLGTLTWTLMAGRRLGVTVLGLAMRPTTSIKHRIKRVDRFLGNGRVDVTVMFEVLGRLWWRGRKRVLMALDWTELRGGFQALVLSVIAHGRGVPIAWQVVTQRRFLRSQNAFEEGLLLLEESYWPKEVERVVLADRGFGRADLMGFLAAHGWGYVLRANPKVWVRDRSGREYLWGDRPVLGDQVLWIRGAGYRIKRNRVETDLVWTWQAKQREAWYLTTNLLDRHRATQVVRWYGRRMWIEEMFRDGKNERWGMGLKEARLRQPSRWERLLLIWAWALLVLMLLGRAARELGWDTGLCSSSRTRLKKHPVLSDLTIGLRVLHELDVPISTMLKLLRKIKTWG